VTQHQRPNAPPASTGPAYAVTPRRLGTDFRILPLSSDGPNFDGIATASAGCVLCEGLESWSEAGLAEALAGCWRMLRPGGLLRVVTPDLDAVIQAYLYAAPDAESASSAMRFNAWRHAVRDRFIFNEEALRLALSRAGFVDPRRFVAGSGSERLFWDLEPADASLLVIEARKPKEVV
jgi:SAM-dependent methyltransferase